MEEIDKQENNKDLELIKKDSDFSFKNQQNTNITEQSNIGLSLEKLDFIDSNKNIKNQYISLNRSFLHLIEEIEEDDEINTKKNSKEKAIRTEFFYPLQNFNIEKKEKQPSKTTSYFKPSYRKKTTKKLSSTVSSISRSSIRDLQDNEKELKEKDVSSHINGNELCFKKRNNSIKVLNKDDMTKISQESSRRGSLKYLDRIDDVKLESYYSVQTMNIEVERRLSNNSFLKKSPNKSHKNINHVIQSNTSSSSLSSLNAIKSNYVNANHGNNSDLEIFKFKIIGNNQSKKKTIFILFIFIFILIYLNLYTPSNLILLFIVLNLFT
jgi:hypothetical protein